MTPIYRGVQQCLGSNALSYDRFDFSEGEWGKTDCIVIWVKEKNRFSTVILPIRLLYDRSIYVTGAPLNIQTHSIILGIMQNLPGVCVRYAIHCVTLYRYLCSAFSS